RFSLIAGTRLTNKIERDFLTCLVKFSLGPTLVGEDNVELMAEKDSVFRRSFDGVVHSGFSMPCQNGFEKRKRCIPHSRRTSSVILEEGGDDVKSS
ncbi:hypothetical protein PHJA_002497500, partial [Phtheirospermum japonicum]